MMSATSQSSSLGRVYTADEYYHHTHANSPFSSPAQHPASPFPSTMFGDGDRTYAEAMHDDEYGRPKKIGVDPEEETRLPLGDAVLPLLLFAAAYVFYTTHTAHSPRHPKRRKPSETPPLG